MANKTEIKAALADLDITFDDKATKAELAALLAENSDGEAPETKSIVPDGFKSKYKAFGGSCGDEMAEVLGKTVKTDKGKVDVTALEEVMAQNDIDTDRWSNLNIGQRRMNLGNVLRARVKRGESVTIGSETWNEDAETKAA